MPRQLEQKYSKSDIITFTVYVTNLHFIYACMSHYMLHGLKLNVTLISCLEASLTSAISRLATVKPEPENMG